MESVLVEGGLVVIAAAVGVVILVVAAIFVMRRSLENGWRATQDQRDLLYDRLKVQGNLVRQFIEVAAHRLSKEGESLEVLGRRQTGVAAGRTPPEKAAALIELNSLLERLIATADEDPGLAGLSEYEVLRAEIEQILTDITRAAATYNETSEIYNRRVAGFFGGMLGAMPVEPFDAKLSKGRARA